MSHPAGNVRFAAQSLYLNAPNMQRMPYGALHRSSASYESDFVSGYRHNGRMSASRRFFSLFCTFDLIFIALLWLICILIDGTDIYEALRQQIIQYDRHNSLFDVVVLALWRFVLLILFYAMLSVNHWFTIAVSTSTSCAFLIFKVFVYNWADKTDHVLHVLIIMISFILAWTETLLLDCHVIPYEQYAGQFAEAARHADNPQAEPLLSAGVAAVPFLNDLHDAPGTSTYHSFINTQRNSDDEREDDSEDEQDMQWKRMGDECVLRAGKLLESDDWVVDRVTDAGDTIRHIAQPIGKVWRITARIEFPAKQLLQLLFYKIDEMPAWNSTVLEAKILRSLNAHTDISYQVSAPVSMVKSRYFVNLRCWHMLRDGRIVDDEADNDLPRKSHSTIGFAPNRPERSGQRMTKPASFHPPSPSTSFDGSDPIAAPARLDTQMVARSGLARSTGATGFFDIGDTFDSELPGSSGENDGNGTPADRSATASKQSLASGELDAVYVSSAISIPYDQFRPKQNCTLADNKLSCWAMREVHGNPDVCVFELLMCIDLKLYVPSSILNGIYPGVMKDYMAELRKYCEHVKEEHLNQQASS